MVESFMHYVAKEGREVTVSTSSDTVKGKQHIKHNLSTQKADCRLKNMWIILAAGAKP